MKKLFTLLLLIGAGFTLVSCEEDNGGTDPDLGVLINGVRWAECNVDLPGTFADTPESYGMFYQWNRRTAWAATGAMTDWDSSTPTGDSWKPANDPCPKGWRVPTNEETGKLCESEKVDAVWTTTPVKGFTFTDKVSGNSIFLPVAGYRNSTEGKLFNEDVRGYYWSSSPESSDKAWYLYILDPYANQMNHGRGVGFTIRCVVA